MVDLKKAWSRQWKSLQKSLLEMLNSSAFSKSTCDFLNKNSESYGSS